MAGPNVGGPSQQDGQPIRMTGEQVGGKGADGNFHIFSTDNFGFLNVNTTGGGGAANTNLIQVGGAAIALGQTTMSASLPVTIASNQTAIPVSGTVTANQGTANTIPNSWPVEITNGTNILGTPSNPLRIDPTGTTVQPVSGTVAVSGTPAFNLTQWAGTVLGTPTNYGTSPGAVIAGSVNAFVTNTVATTLASTTITGTVAVTQSTSPWVVSLASTTVTNTVADNLTQVAGVTLGATAVTAFGTAPAAANVPGVNSSLFSGTTALTNTAGALNVNMTSTTVTGTVTVAGAKSNNSVVPGATNLGVLPGIANAATQTWTEGDQVLESMDLSGRQRFRGTLTANNAAPSSDGQMALTTVANAAAPTYVEGNLVLASVDLNGATRVVGTRTNNSAAPSFQIGTIPALANAASPTWVEGNQVLESVDLTGRQRVRGTLTNNNAAPTADLEETMTAIATTAAPSYTNNNAVMLSTDLTGNLRVTPTAIGTLTNNNAAPGAVNLGVLPALANAVAPTWTEGDQVLLSVDLKGAQRINQFEVAGVATVAASAGVQKVGISGATGATLDGVITGATAPPNGLMVMGVYQGGAAGFITTGQSLALQGDAQGSLIVKPYRRTQTASLATTISNTLTATTVVTAGAAAVFADISNLMITATPAATTALVFTATLSDGTKSYIFDMDTGTVASSVGAPINIVFNPPLPATTAATAWTLALSVNTVTVHVTTVTTLNKAS
jgi:hypothetical protein